MKLLITGASGLYGSKIAELAVKNGHTVYSVHSQHTATSGIPIKLDVSDKTEVESQLKNISPDVIVHAASMTDVDKCEQNRELAWKINVEGTNNIVKAAKINNAYFLHISTDYVFDGEKGRYNETDLPSPLSYYGYTKLKAEELIKNNLKDYCIARTSVIYGAIPAAGKINFALWVLNKLKNKEQTKLFIDQWNSPTLNTNLADMTFEAVERRLTGIFHLSGATRINRYDFGVAIAKAFILDESLLVPAHMKDLAFPAKRPRDSSLDTARAEQTLQKKPLRIEQAIENLKKELSPS
jgi:dTDP-4-dehydrorhamnose reductase